MVFAHVEERATVCLSLCKKKKKKIPQLQIDQRPQHKTWNSKLVEAKIGRILQDIYIDEEFFNETMIAQDIRPMSF